MATVEHADIIDPQIHEPKGITTAAANRVYLSDGVGSGTWSRVPPNALTESVTAFGSQLLHVQYTGVLIVPPNMEWANTLLNTVVTNDISANLETNTITLSAGTYLIDGFVSAQGGAAADLPASHETRLYNSTTSSTIFSGTCDYFAGNQLTSTPGWRADFQIMQSFLKGRFTLGSTANINIQNNVKHNNIIGLPSSKLWHNILIWKVA